MIRIGILGCGRIACIYHLPILSATHGARVVVLAEPDEASRREAARLVPGVRTVADWRAVLEDPSVEALAICLPTGLHAESARAAFEAGKHVYLEKPIATTIEDARDVVAAWRSSGRIGMMGFNQRFHPAVLRAREEIRRGTIGRVIGARIESGAPPRDLPTWKRRREEGGGVLLDAFSHHVDLARFLFADEVRDVAADLVSIRTEADNAWATMTMASGVRVESRTSFTSVQQNRFEVMGDKGGLSVDRIQGRMTVLPMEPAWERGARIRHAVGRWRELPRAVRSLFATPRDPSYALALSAFVKAVRENSPGAPNLEDGERSLAVVLAAETAARDGGRVTVVPLRV